jgi:hypothetical protein
VSDLADRLKAATVAAIDGIAPALTDPAMLRYVTVEIELGNNGQVIDGRARIERAVNVKRLLAGPPAPGEG